MDLTGRQLGPYQVKDEIGRGGMAVIYRALDTRHGETVALKVMLPHLAYEAETRHRFQQEGENAKRLIHPNIVRVYEAGQIDDHYYIAMEYAGGGTLAGLLKTRSRPMNVNEALPTLYRVAAALDYAHNRGILHRDIKLSNILIGSNQQILLSDFGIARRLGGDHTVVTTTGYTVGTPSYMSPEQARGDETIDHRSDIYSLGVVAYVMLTHTLPFEADTPLVLLRKVIDVAPCPPEKINPLLPLGISYVLQRVLAKHPTQRYTNATEFTHALETGTTWKPTAQEWSALTQTIVEPVPVPVTPRSRTEAANARPPSPIVQPPTTTKRLRTGWLILAGGATMMILMLLAVQTWGGNLTSLFDLKSQIPTINSSGISSEQHVIPNVTPQSNQLALAASAAMPIVLSSYVDPDWQISIDIPKSWSQSRLGDRLYFEAPDHLAWAFIEHLPNAKRMATAEQVLADYLVSGKTPFQTYEASDSEVRQIGSLQAQTQHFQATLLGGAHFAGQLLAVIADQKTFIYGISIAQQAEENLSPVAELIIESFTVLPESVASVSATSNATPTPHPSATPVIVAVATEKTRTLAQSLTRMIAASELVASVASSILTLATPIEFTPTPPSTATPKPTVLPTKLPIATSTRRSLPVSIAKLLATSTPIPELATATPTFVPTATATFVPTATSTRIVAPTIIPTLVQTNNTAITNFADTSVSLLTPAEGDTFNTKMNFSWNANFDLPEGYLFEPVFWRAGEDPLRDGRGYGGTTKETTLSITADVFRATGEGEYYWGILLVKAPYIRETYLGGKRLIHVKLSGSSSSSDHVKGEDGR